MNRGEQLYEKEAGEPPIESMHITPNEIKKELPEAEDIARLRAELEQKMFSEAIPPEKWPSAYDEAIKHYPRAAPYGPLIETALKAAEEDHENIESLVRRYQPEITTDPENFRVEKITSEAAKNIFSDLFGFAPSEEIELYKGAVSLRFAIGENDYGRLRAVETNRKDQKKSGGFAYKANGIPVIVLRKSLPRNLEYPVVFWHEFEHTKNRILSEADINLKFYPEKLDLPSNILPIVRKRGSEDGFSEEGAKDELLAYFTVVEITNEDQPEFEKKVDEYCRTVFGYLSDPDGLYFQDHGVQDANRHSKIISKGITAMKDLYFLYRANNENINPARMTINVLEQFPLNSWPAVARLIIARHNAIDKNNRHLQ